MVQDARPTKRGTHDEAPSLETEGVTIPIASV